MKNLKYLSLIVLLFAAEAFARREITPTKINCGLSPLSEAVSLNVSGYAPVKLEDFAKASNSVECFKLNWKSGTGDYNFISVLLNAKISTSKKGDVTTKQQRIFLVKSGKLEEKLESSFETPPRWFEDGSHLVIVEIVRNEEGQIEDGLGYAFKASTEVFIDYMVLKNEHLYK